VSIPPQAYYDPPNFLVIYFLFPLFPSPLSSYNGLWVYSNGRGIQADLFVFRTVSVNPNDCEFKGGEPVGDTYCSRPASRYAIEQPPPVPGQVEHSYLERVCRG
jgi:hypothetical protein